MDWAPDMIGRVWTIGLRSLCFDLSGSRARLLSRLGAVGAQVLSFWDSVSLNSLPMPAGVLRRTQ